MLKISIPAVLSRFPRLFLIMAAVALLGALPAGASTIVFVGNVSANSPSTGNTLEIDLTNTGPTALSLASFSFEIKVTDPHITFTSATTATAATYVFAGNSLFGPTISTSAPGQTLDASDSWGGVGGAAVASGATVGLGHVLFNVSAGDSPGPVTVTLSAFPATSLTDSAGANIAIITLTSGSITIPGSAVPEPSTVLLASLGMLALAAFRYCRTAG